MALADGRRGAENEYAEVFDRWLASGAADFDDRFPAVLADLGIDGVVQADRLSGGEFGRLALATVPLAEPEILLLDEPTNDLDGDGLERLEGYVQGSPARIVLVSHDRTFLAATVDRIVELDEHTRGATEYRGGWESSTPAGSRTATSSAKRRASPAPSEPVRRRPPPNVSWPASRRLRPRWSANRGNCG